MEQLIFGLLGLGAIAYAALCLALWWGQTRLIFHPQPAPTTTPASVGLAYEDIQISVAEGHIHGWWLPHEAPHAKTALVLHGNASNVADTLNQTQPLLAAGLSALVIDYRGYGRSSGPFPNESRAYADAAAAWAYLVETRGIPADAIVIFGHSIGGAIAIDLAYHQPQAAGLIVQASFTSMTAMMDHVGYSRIVPKWLLHQRFDSITKIASVSPPLLLIHGLADTTVPARMSEALQAAAAAPKQLWLLPGAEHNDIAEIAHAHYIDRLKEWLKDHQQTHALSTEIPA
ncbi:MAG: alpha/beta hydrolase [Leptolyngbyaceae cyanobacterium]